MPWLHGSPAAEAQPADPPLLSVLGQVSVLTDQVEAQGEKIRDLEVCLEGHQVKLNAAEEMLQQVSGAGVGGKDLETHGSSGGRAPGWVQVMEPLLPIPSCVVFTQQVKPASMGRAGGGGGGEEGLAQEE